MSVNILGKRYGRLLVIQKTEERLNGCIVWLCKCDCEKEKKVNGDKLRQGVTKSCGCLMIDRIKETNTTHGMGNKRVYRIWSLMKNRCLNANSVDYKRYGGRGIMVCKEWEKFENFWKDMKVSYEPNLTLDRIDNNKGYCKENCRWANKFVQNNNQRKNVFIEFKGEKLTVSQLMRKLNIYTNSGIYYSRLKNGWTVEKTFTTSNTRRSHV